MRRYGVYRTVHRNMHPNGFQEIPHNHGVRGWDWWSTKLFNIQPSIYISQSDLKIGHRGGNDEHVLAAPGDTVVYGETFPRRIGAKTKKLWIKLKYGPPPIYGHISAHTLTSDHSRSGVRDGIRYGGDTDTTVKTHSRPRIQSGALVLAPEHPSYISYAPAIADEGPSAAGRKHSHLHLVQRNFSQFFRKFQENIFNFTNEQNFVKICYPEQNFGKSCSKLRQKFWKWAYNLLAALKT
ncbi:hypothetical protein B0H14DRAFT_2607585 [Mycena olivaceomarginata]|nr:hypothetical protein B0H14DRAFT_2607585 [Mycena olivaceomarginata]